MVKVRTASGKIVEIQKNDRLISHDGFYNLDAHVNQIRATGQYDDGMGMAALIHPVTIAVQQLNTLNPKITMDPDFESPVAIGTGQAQNPTYKDVVYIEGEIKEGLAMRKSQTWAGDDPDADGFVLVEIEDGGDAELARIYYKNRMRSGK